MNRRPTSFDVHTHIGVDLGFYLGGWWPYACSTRELLAHLDEAGVDRAVCFPFTLPSAFDVQAFARDRRVELLPGRCPYDLENDRLLAEIEQLDTDHRLMPFAMFDPARQVQQQLTWLERNVKRLFGLKTQSTVLQSPITALLDESADLMHFAADHDLPVLMHTAVLPEDHWAQASDCPKVAKRYPNVRFNLAHSLRFDAPCLEEASGQPNVWVDCSAHLIHCQLARQDSPAVAPVQNRVDADYESAAGVLEAVHAILGDRYLWGSDYPFCSWCDDQIRGIYTYQQEAAVLSQLDPSIRTEMTSDAPRAWLFGGEEQKK